MERIWQYPRLLKAARIAGYVLFFVAVLAVATFRSQVVRAAAHPPMAEEVFKNVQVLRGIPVDEFLGAMGIIASSVGFCSSFTDTDSVWPL